MKSARKYGVRTTKRLAELLRIASVVSFTVCLALAEAQEPDRVYTAGGDVRNPVPIKKTLPRYTDEAIKAKVQWTILLQVVIRRDGSVDSFRILKPLGYGLDKKAIEEISNNWVFRPGTLNGKPVDVRATIKVTFTLRGGNRGGLVSDVDGATLILNVGTAAGLKAGDVLTIVRDTRTVLREFTSEVGWVRIDQADEGSSLGTVTSGSDIKVGDVVKN